MVNTKKKKIHKKTSNLLNEEQEGNSTATLPSKSISLLEESDSKNLLPVPATNRNLQVYTGDITDPLTLYIREINRYDLLSPEQEQALTQALKETGDIEVAKQLVMANLRLVVKIAMEYRSAYANVMDLIQEGNIGLMKAVSKYDSERGAKLSYYASWWIKSYILKFILDNFRLIKIGTTNEQKKLFYNLMKEKERLKALGIDPTLEQISKQLGVSEKSVVLMEERLSPSGKEVSLEQPLGSSQGSGTLGDTIPHQQNLEAEVDQEQGLDILNANMEKFLLTLKERDREIFKKRLLSEIPDSLQKIADQYGVSRERIRQIEERLLKRLTVYMSEFIR
ncbi:MAG: RNA polymerase factor sigma-32 [Bdellovibrionales bacterium]|jgi:RNA polymerase sigma-32 factor|nr:RNA polymerase factor sigma-32 [Bdellovibrionales bacterium]MBT3526228.1 RNA polymerase factor sigma-32 [Bdellovibrionales bacterium]MBT7668756.1 RNA polymerase factor sigma-32 [Bdellovibrionales bacterium]